MEVQQGLCAELLQQCLDAGQLALKSTAAATDPDKASGWQSLLPQAVQSLAFAGRRALDVKDAHGFAARQGRSAFLQ
jgi:hypothetical protein